MILLRTTQGANFGASAAYIRDKTEKVACQMPNLRNADMIDIAHQRERYVAHTERQS